MAKKYLQVYEQLKADLYEKYPIGSTLPTEPELMQIYNASRTTLRHAIAMLREERLVEVRQGRGTQVLLQHYAYNDSDTLALFHNVSDITCKFVEPDGASFTHGLIVDQIPASEIVAKQLEVLPGAMIYRVERILEKSGKPFAFFKNYYPRDLFPDLEQISGREDILKNLYRFFEEKYGVYFKCGKETITAQIASLFDAKLLDMQSGTPLLALHRVAYTANHKIMEYSERLVRPDLLRITVSMSGSPRYDK